MGQSEQVVKINNSEVIFKHYYDQDIQLEIDRLSKEMSTIVTDTIPFDKWDYIAVFSIGLLEIAADIVAGNQQVAKSNPILFKNIHDKLNHEGQPLDYQGFKFGGGDHRARTYGHDLLAFPVAIYSLVKGQFVDGYIQDGKYNLVKSLVNQFGTEYEGLSIDQAIIAYLIHMTADFFSSNSLPVPGFGILAHAPAREIRKIVANMYSDGFNLRDLSFDAIAVSSTEILMRIYFYIRTRNQPCSKEAKQHKLNTLLLMAHGMAGLVNIGKVIFTENPALINLPMMMRIMVLLWKVSKENIELTHRTKVKVNLAILKTKYETLQTLIVLNRAICFTYENDLQIMKKAIEFDKVHQANEQDISAEFDDLSKQIKKNAKMRLGQKGVIDE